MNAKQTKIEARLRQFALSFPEAYEDFPWGEIVVKVNKKIFVFLGMADGSGDHLSIGVKLPESGEGVLMMEHVKKMGYNLGKSGWIHASFPASAPVPIDLIEDWIDESYRAIAPKKLIVQISLKLFKYIEIY